MAMEEKLNKSIYKIELYLLKVIPIIISILYFINTTFSCLGINIEIFSIVGGMSLLPILFFYVSSYAFKFCNYHRMFHDYISISEILAWIDYKYYIIPNDKIYLTISIILYNVTIFIAIYMKFNNHV